MSSCDCWRLALATVMDKEAPQFDCPADICVMTAYSLPAVVDSDWERRLTRRQCFLLSWSGQGKSKFF